MKLDQLKKGLFGYQKASVYEYITLLEEDFSARLSAKDTECQKIHSEYQGRIVELEEELQRVREQLEQQRAEQMTIASTLMEATRYAEALRQEARETAEKERAEWEKALQASQKELDGYHSQIQNIREMFRGLLKTMEGQSQELEWKMEAVKSTCPDHNMTLFERKIGTEA